MLSLKIPFLSIVLIKVDFNISSQESLYRISSAKKTILELVEEGYKVVLISHLGRPKSNEEEFSTKQLLDPIKKVLQKEIEFINQFDSFDKAKQTIKESSKKVFLLENTRFDPKEDSKNIEEKYNLAKKYASLGDFFIDEAFSVSHRSEATNVYIKKFLPFAYGYRYNLEVENLNKLKNAQKPYYVVLGGAKLETKIPLIENVIKKVDKIFIGGLISITFLKYLETTGHKVPSIFDTMFDRDLLNKAGEIYELNKDKIILPVDLVYKSIDGKVVASDIGSLSTNIICDSLMDAKTIFWNGPLGEIENPAFAYSTVQLVKTLVKKSNEVVIVGGGDTEKILNKDDKNLLTFVSTGGGASLEYISKL